MASAGYPDGKDFPETEILYNTNEGHRESCRRNPADVENPSKHRYQTNQSGMESLSGQ